MPNNTVDVNRRNYFNLLLLIGAMRPATGYVDASTFPHAAKRYARELKKVGIELASDEKAVQDAINIAVEDKILRKPDDNTHQFPIVEDAERLTEALVSAYNHLTPQELLLAKAAARVTKKAYVWGQLDKDLG